DPVAHAAVRPAQQVIGDDLVVVVRGVRKGAAAVAIADRVDAGHVRPQCIVDDDEAAFVGGHARGGKPQVVCVRHPSDREQQVRTGDFPATLGTIQLYDDSRAALLHDHALGTGFDDHAFVAQDVRHAL